ncbi:MAG: glycogen/starch/alpha-glucan phosphorylase [Bacillales bacterium]|nr:glycogen/starch/alpha-glucan phosphorylase [Bacillales bacterium]
MFTNKEEFKKEFQKRCITKYGNDMKKCHITELYDVLGTMVRDYVAVDWKASKDYVNEHNGRQLVYFSMEFLIGRLLVNNMQNLGIYQVAKEGLLELGINIHDLEEQESDAGLGNGGLGRLAACFLDSIASLGFPGHGNCIRYEYGFFRQKIIDGKQIEVPDQWLANQYVWEIKKPKHAVEVKFYGQAETYQDYDGCIRSRTINAMAVKAVPYDVPVIGYDNHVVNTLRLWSAEPTESQLPSDLSFDQYLQAIKEICHGLYPDDSTEHGRILRLRQQYFLVSAGLQSMIRGHKRRYGTLSNMYEKFVFQLNDTHPILSIPELMRLLMDEHGFGWDDAWYQVTHMMAYTNHTIMAEALEKWPVTYVSNLLPRVYMIIEEIDRRFILELRAKGYNDEFIHKVRIIKDGMIHMTNLGIHACYSVNGVAKLHTEICCRDTFKEFYQIYPEKFNNKTNGITHRRWFLNANPEMANLVTSCIGDSWIKNPNDLSKFMDFIDNEDVQNKFLEIKHQNKIALANYIKTHNGIDVDVDSMFDVQVKRLHAYKRQLMNVFKIMYFYFKMKEDPSFRIVPHTFVFGAKAAPSYYYAKKIIQLINGLANKVNNDPEVNKYMKVVFIENYGVSSAEVIIPAADVSEQISLAGKEASGTSNMKFMINGALTLGTLDGANVEIDQLVGSDNDVIFGLKTPEVETIKHQGTYTPWDLYNSKPYIKKIMDSLVNGTWSRHNDEFRVIFDEIMYRNDEYLSLLDLDAYVEASLKMDHKYLDRKNWARSCLVNIAQAGYFSSDRTINQYVEDIWHLDNIKF